MNQRNSHSGATHFPDGHGRRLATFTAAVLAMVVLAAATVFGGAGKAKDAAPRPAKPSPRGTVVTAFGSRRIEALGVAVQRDGKLVVAGLSSRRGGFEEPRDLAVVRYLPDGRLDRSFGTGGKVLTRIGPRFYGSGLAIQPDGKIVAGGSTLVRYLPDGRVDTSFGTGGKVVTRFGRTLVLQGDGKIVVGGADGHHARFALARYLPNGRLDASFGTNGRAATADFGTDSSYTNAGDYISAVAIQNDGRIVAAGAADACGACNLTKFALARYLPTGRLDRRFGRNGGVRDLSYAQAKDVAIQPDGTIVAAGSWGDGEGLALGRYRPNGRLDASFGAGGHVLGDGAPEQAAAVALQRDGKIVLAGVRTPLPKAWDANDFAVRRYERNGRLDRSFGSRGLALTSFTRRGTDSAGAIAIQADGKIIAAGSSGSGDFALARYMTNGQLDPSFGRGG